MRSATAPAAGPGEAAARRSPRNQARQHPCGTHRDRSPCSRREPRRGNPCAASGLTRAFLRNALPRSRARRTAAASLSAQAGSPQRKSERWRRGKARCGKPGGPCCLMRSERRRGGGSCSAPQNSSQLSLRVARAALPWAVGLHLDGGARGGAPGDAGRVRWWARSLWRAWLAVAAVRNSAIRRASSSVSDASVLRRRRRLFHHRRVLLGHLVHLVGRRRHLAQRHRLLLRRRAISDTTRLTTSPTSR